MKELLAGALRPRQRVVGLVEEIREQRGVDRAACRACAVAVVVLLAARRLVDRGVDERVSRGRCRRRSGRVRRRTVMFAMPPRLSAHRRPASRRGGARRGCSRTERRGLPPQRRARAGRRRRAGRWPRRSTRAGRAGASRAPAGPDTQWKTVWPCEQMRSASPSKLCAASSGRLWRSARRWPCRCG